MINILITSFNDCDINNTIKSLLENSGNSENLKFKILLIETDNIDKEYYLRNNFEIFYIPKNKGVGFSRKILTENLPKNEYVLQLDSHHRFIKNWDIELIENYVELKKKHKKIVISTYLPHFDENNRFTECFTYPKIFNYTKNGIPKFACTCGKENTETGLISGHFLFSETKIFDEIKYKDYWYFFGEEILLSIHAFNNNYKVFTPKKIIAWHRYSTDGVIKRDLKIENKLYKHVKEEMDMVFNSKFCELIDSDYINFKCSQRNYYIHNTYDYDIIDILTPKNDKIRIYNHQNEDIIKFSADGFFKGAVLYNTKDKRKKYFSLTT